jgi:flagellar FliL protein
MAEEEIKEEEAAVEKDSKKSLPFLKWIVMALAIVVLGAAGFGGWWYYKTHFSSPPKKEAEQMVQVKKAIWPIDSIIVNLIDNNGERYLKTTIQVEVSNEDCISELDSLKPETTDSLLDLLSSKEYKEIVDFEGKQRLRDEIAIRLNNYLSKGQVTKVYFTEFIIQ